MQSTRHFEMRMSQRGMSRKMVDLVLQHGVQEDDRIVLGRREATQLVESLTEELRLAKKVLDKGGVVVVAAGEALLTTYNCRRRKH